MFSAARFAVVLLPLLAATARAVSLSDFTPRVENLSSQCKAVYDREITDCSAADLQTGDNCSVACISGLLATAQLVKSACADDHVKDDSIIGVFLLGNGPSTLCSNMQATTLGGGQSSTAPSTSTEHDSTSTTTAATTSATAASTTTTATTATSASTLHKSTLTAATTTAAETSTPVETSTTADSSTGSKASSLAATSSSASADPNNGSGGGSPFDLAPGSNSSRSAASTWLVVTALGVWTLLMSSFS